MLCKKVEHVFQEMHAGDQENDFQRIFQSENWPKKCHDKKKHVPKGDLGVIMRSYGVT